MEIALYAAQTFFIFFSELIYQRRSVPFYASIRIFHSPYIFADRDVRIKSFHIYELQETDYSPAIVKQLLFYRYIT